MKGEAPELAIAIPTRDRAPVVAETIRRTGSGLGGAPVEVIVVADAPDDETVSAVRAALDDIPVPGRVAERTERGGPAAARNTALRMTEARACLFLGDDVRPLDDLVTRHLAFHRSHPEPSEGVEGRIVPAPPHDRSEFVRWLHEEGKQFAYGLLKPGEPVPAAAFYANNASLKRQSILDAGGFDERFAFGHEEHDLARRLQANGVRIRFEPAAIAEHLHPADLGGTLARMHGMGRSYRTLTDVWPDEPVPRRPDARHRLKAGALTPLAALGGRRARRAAWAFLCEEAHREGYWEASDGNATTPRIGGSLARVAEKRSPTP